MKRASLLVFVASLPARGADPTASPQHFSHPAVLYYSVGALVLALAGLGIYRWILAWQQRARKERDEEIFRLADQWTKNLQQEVADRKEAQRALQASQEFIMRQERLAAVGQLAAGLAHEFNNIMTIIQGHASLLMDNPNLDEESIKSLAIINDGVERTARLIKQMLAFSRRQVMQQKLIEVKETLAHTEEMLGQLLGRQVALRFEIAAGLPPILADQDMFQQIIVNLVVNARDAMSSGGKLTIRASLATFAAADLSVHAERRAGQFIRLSVSDTGSGMNNAVVKHLFEPFFTTKDVGKGMGLGLATVHGMVNQNQGWIEVESEIGKGTTFDIYFPVAAQAAKKAEAQPVVPLAAGGKETVLIVEDEEMLREMLREILTANGYQVLEAANGLQALRLWEENHSQIELLLTDNVLPDGMTGLELAAKLRVASPGLPVILSSGCSPEALLANPDNPAGCSFLSKPYRPAQLIQAVRHALDAARSAAPLAASAQPTSFVPCHEH
jgi:signal transduction histidine kinase/ActR/RegA family two-component response regulator